VKYGFQNALNIRFLPLYLPSPRFKTVKGHIPRLCFFTWKPLLLLSKHPLVSFRFFDSSNFTAKTRIEIH
jgi:hypothetical protein